jgi:HEAT repeat protein
MRQGTRWVIAAGCLLAIVGVLAVRGCNPGKSTDQLIGDLKSPEEKDRLIAVRLLPQKKRDAAKVIPALVEALQDKDPDIRISAAIGLGYFGDEAKEAIPPLQAALRDRDPRVREAAGHAIARIRPELAPKPNPTHGNPR